MRTIRASPTRRVRSWRRPSGLPCVLAAGLTLAAWAGCASGSPLGESKMACCVTMKHECGGAGEEHKCCETDQQAQQSFVVASVKPIVVGSADVAGTTAQMVRPGPAPDLRPSIEPFDRSLFKRPHEPTYLRLSVLLI